MTPAPEPQDPVDLLAEAHAARVMAREFGLAAASGRETDGRETAGRPKLAELLAHARRAPGEPIDMATERHLRRDRGAMARYRRVLGGLAMAHSPVAMAAFSPGVAVERRMGDYTVTVVDDSEDAAPALVVTAPQGHRWPASIEAHLGEDSVRLALPPPIGDGLTILLDPAIAETALLARLIRAPDCELYLL